MCLGGCAGSGPLLGPAGYPGLAFHLLMIGVDSDTGASKTSVSEESDEAYKDSAE